MASSSPSEHEIQQRIRLACGRGAVRLWRNNTGALVDQQGRFVRFGLCKGSSDLIGLRSVVVTPKMVGQRIAQFVALETIRVLRDRQPGAEGVSAAGAATGWFGGGLSLHRAGPDGSAPQRPTGQTALS